MDNVLERLNEKDSLLRLSYRSHFNYTDGKAVIHETHGLGPDYFWWIYYPEVAFTSMSDIKKAYGVA